jgi:aminopeptidase N
MFHTMLGAEKFRAGTDLYFERHDGEAATCDQFVKALEDASGIDLSPFKIWYSQAGTPHVEARLEQDADGNARLHLSQRVEPTPGQPSKRPMAIPLRTALIGAASGTELGDERLILLDREEAVVDLGAVGEPALLSINRDFSAPVIMKVERASGELEKLAQSDSDPFARYEAIQELMTAVLIARTRGEAADAGPVIRGIESLLKSNSLSAAFKAEAIVLPSESLVGDRMDKVDPDAIHAAREGLRTEIGAALGGLLGEVHGSSATDGDDLSPDAKGQRRLRSVALGLVAAGDEAKGARLSKAQYDAADNMTDRQGALAVLASLSAAERVQALDDFYARFDGNDLVIDKWFALQASAQRSDTIDEVERLATHPAFTISNPNRLRALAGTFAANQWAFHDASGRGYRFLAGMIIAADKLNPQVAARMVPPLGRWGRFDDKRAALMRAELERILATPGLSRDVYEQASKSLG